MTEQPLGDIKDVRAYVRGVIRRQVPDPVDSVDEEDLISEGVVILLELFEKLDPSEYRSFSKFASRALGNGLFDYRRKEARMRGIMVRLHSNEYVMLNRTSYETLVDTEMEPHVFEPVMG